MRKDLSWRHATETDLDRISHIQTITRWGRPPEGMSKRAARVLGFFAALNRLGTFGYRGTRCCQAALARAVSRATNEAASIPTIQRALAELVKGGFLTRGTAYGKPRRMMPDVWQREPIRVYTLTETAVSIWSKPTKVASLPTYIKREPFRSSELKFQENFKPERAHTREQDVVSNVTNKGRKNEMTNSRDLTSEGESYEGKQEQKSRPSRFVGISERCPSAARKRLLQDLCNIVAGRGRMGKVIAAKAALCLSDPSQKSGVDWQYWLTRWPMMTRGERMHALRTEIVPVMNTWVQPEPKPIERAPEPEMRAPVAMEQVFDGLKNRGFDSDLLARLAKKCG